MLAKGELIVTSDGSHTILLPELGEPYHSRNGAVQESRHVFIQAGWNYFLEKYPHKEKVKILEMGFGTGLNALITLWEAKKRKVSVDYQAIEAFPVDAQIVSRLNYGEWVGEKDLSQHFFQQMHYSPWGKAVEVDPYFTLVKHPASLEAFETEEKYDLIFFDAFAPEVQPELWSVEIFRKLYSLMEQGAVLTTYCAKGSVRRAMLEAGMRVERLPGPPGKREMLRGEKINLF